MNGQSFDQDTLFWKNSNFISVIFIPSVVSSFYLLTNEQTQKIKIDQELWRLLVVNHFQVQIKEKVKNLNYKRYFLERFYDCSRTWMKVGGANYFPRLTHYVSFPLFQNEFVVIGGTDRNKLGGTISPAYFIFRLDVLDKDTW